MASQSTVTYSGANNAGSQIGTNAGSVINHFHASGETRPQVPRAIIPFGKDQDFINRGDVLPKIKENLVPGARLALVGLGGVGKSQLAIEYCYQVRNEKPETWVVWVHASSPSNFEQGYKAIAQELGLVKDNQSEDILLLVKSWLSDESNGKWLLVIDNADDTETFSLPRELKSGTFKLDFFLPQCPHGSILFTSRDRNAVLYLLNHRSSSILDIKPMNMNEGKALVEAKLGPGHSQVTELVEVLEGIPLAITQATAYIQSRGSRGSISKYLEAFHANEKRRGNLLMSNGGDVRRPHDAKNSILITWQISFEYIKTHRLTAANLLSLMSFFNQQDIPDFILKDYSIHTKAKGQAIENEDSENAGPEDEFDQDLAMLEGFNLISAEVGKEAYQMHRLVHFCTQKWLEGQQDLDKWNQTFLQLIERNFPEGEFENWDKCKILYPHAERLAQKRPSGRVSQLSWAAVLKNLCWYSWRMGKYRTAEKLAENALTVYKDFLSEGHESLMVTSQLLASSLGFQGRNEAAEKQNRLLLQLRQKYSGPNHPSTLVIMGNLAGVLESQGNYVESEQLNRKVLQLSQEYLGPNHPDTFGTMSNLALVLMSQGKYAESEHLNQEVLQLCQQHLGPNHPDTLTTMSNLSTVLNRQGKYAESEQLDQQVLQLKQQSLGPNHPSTLTTMSNLATVLNRQGKYAESEQLNRAVLQLKHQYLGPNHPETFATMSNLALALNRQGKYAESEQLNRAVLQLKHQYLGPNHPETFATMGRLAFVLVYQEDYIQADVLYKRAIDGLKVVLGEHHPRVGIYTKLHLDMLQRWERLRM